MEICASISTLLHPGLPNTLLSSWRVNPDRASGYAQWFTNPPGSPQFSVAWSGISVGAATAAGELISTAPRGSCTYLNSNTLPLFHSFPSVGVGGGYGGGRSLRQSTAQTVIKTFLHRALEGQSGRWLPSRYIPRFNNRRVNRRSFLILLC